MTRSTPPCKGLNQSTLRRLISQALALEDLSDTLPAALRAELALPTLPTRCTLHHPPPDCAQQALALRRLPAWQRLKFDELLAQQLAMRILYRQRRHGGSPRLCGDGRLRQALLAQLPFALTAAQQRVLAEIDADLASPHPMRRLLQGDVGSGKTVVAALAALTAIEAGYQAALMAPPSCWPSNTTSSCATG